MGGKKKELFSVTYYRRPRDTSVSQRMAEKEKEKESWQNERKKKKTDRMANAKGEKQQLNNAEGPWKVDVAT